MLLYVLLSLAALALVLAPMVTSSGAPHLPPFLERIWPWRWLLSLVLATLALLVLIAQSGLGFGLENAVDAMVQEKVAAEKLPSATPEEQQIVELNEGKYAGSLNVHRTWWWRLALIAQLASVLGLAGEWPFTAHQSVGRPRRFPLVSWRLSPDAVSSRWPRPHRPTGSSGTWRCRRL